MVPLLLAVALTTQGIVPPAVRPADAPAPAHILVVFRPSPALPAPIAVTAQEIERVWQHAGMTFRWATTLPSGELLDGAPPDRVITVIVTDHPSDGTQIPEGALGAVPIAAGRMRQLIYVAPTAVKTLLAAAAVTPADGRFASLYARTIGRVVAHELGHLLLRSVGHRRDGLMRRAFVVRDVLSSDESRFALGSSDLRVVQQRLAATRRDPAPATAPAEITILAQARPLKQR